MELVEFQYQRLRRYVVKAGAAMGGLVSPRMSQRMFFLDFIVYPILIVACLIVAFGNDSYGQWLESLALVVFGYGFWTLAEYLVHRFVLHHVPMFSAVHNAHHDAPRELIGTPTVLSVAVFFCSAFLPVAEFYGVRPAGAWLAGLLSGYLSYAAIHYAVHHLGSGGYGLVKRLKRQHGVHHHRNGNCNFGVTTSLWDRLFGTLAD